jgi:hypothetical protein
MAGVVSRSGRWVFRVLFEDSMMGNRVDVRDTLTGMDARLEWSSASLGVVDAADADHAQQVADYLWEQQTAGRLVCETGKT